MEKVLDWSNKWKVSFNPSKTELLFIGNCPDDFEIILNNTPIKPIDSHKHLVLTFSSNAKWLANPGIPCDYKILTDDNKV